MCIAMRPEGRTGSLPGCPEKAETPTLRVWQMSRSATLRRADLTNALATCGIACARTSGTRSSSVTLIASFWESLTPDALTADPVTLIERVTDPGPVTFRPNLRVGEMPDYVKKQGIQSALVTTSDGALIGVVRL